MIKTTGDVAETGAHDDVCEKRAKRKSRPHYEQTIDLNIEDISLNGYDVNKQVPSSDIFFLGNNNIHNIDQ